MGLASLGGTDDETAIDDIMSQMVSMCGNAGQHTLISRNYDAFYDWAMDALEVEGEFGSFEDMMGSLDVSMEDHSYQGTVEIWRAGYQGLIDQSAYHDSYDETGEGTGDNVSGSGGGET